MKCRILVVCIQFSACTNKQEGGSDSSRLTLSGLTCLRSLSSVVCAALKEPQPVWFTVTVSFQSQQWQCGLCCIEGTTASLVHCDHFLSVTAVTMWSVLHWRNHSQSGLLWPFLSNHSSDNAVLTSIREKEVPSNHSSGNAVLTSIREKEVPSNHSSDNAVLTSIREKEVPSNHSSGNAVLTSIIPSNHSSGNAVLTSIREKEVRCNYGRLTTVINMFQKWCKDYRLCSLLWVISLLAQNELW